MQHDSGEEDELPHSNAAAVPGCKGDLNTDLRTSSSPRPARSVTQYYFSHGLV